MTNNGNTRGLSSEELIKNLLLDKIESLNLSIRHNASQEKQWQVKCDASRKYSNRIYEDALSLVKYEDALVNLEDGRL